MARDILPRNPIPPELQDLAKELYRGIEHFKWSHLSAAEQKIALQLDRALIPFFNINEHDPLDDTPRHMVHLGENGEFIVTPMPAPEVPLGLSDAEFLRACGIIPDAK
jgi:hypothetical protein